MKKILVVVPCISSKRFPANIDRADRLIAAPRPNSVPSQLKTLKLVVSVKYVRITNKNGTRQTAAPVQAVTNK